MPHRRNFGEFGCPTYNQAAKIIARFGGEASLARMIGVSRVTVYRWQYKRPYGSDGLIPTIQIEKIRKVARIQGILLRDEDWSPQKNVWDGETLLNGPKVRKEKPELAYRGFSDREEDRAGNTTLQDLLS